MADLKDQLIRLGSERPELRDHIRPVLDRLSAKETLESNLRRTMKGWMTERAREYEVKGMSSERAADRAAQDFLDMVEGEQREFKKKVLNRL